MRSGRPFGAADLEELDARLFAPARRVVPMYDVARGDTAEDVIGLRHDVDDNPGAFETALRMAAWECERGYSSTYYLLHGSHYWEDGALVRACEFEELGHEVGLHVNAIAVALRERRSPHSVLEEALHQLRSTGARVTGCTAHGDELCHVARFVNDEIFSEVSRPDWGKPGRLISWEGVNIPLRKEPRGKYGLAYDGAWLPRGDYLSDSAGHWSKPFEDVVERREPGQLHVLIHPDWWAGAFVRQEVAR